jgi:hypothetical protein
VDCNCVDREAQTVFDAVEMYSVRGGRGAVRSVLSLLLLHLFGGATSTSITSARVLFFGRVGT